MDHKERVQRPATHRQFGLLALLLLSISTVAFCQQDEAGKSLHSLHLPRSEVAVAFDLGQSYG